MQPEAKRAKVGEAGEAGEAAPAGSTIQWYWAGDGAIGNTITWQKYSDSANALV